MPAVCVKRARGLAFQLFSQILFSGESALANEALALVPLPLLLMSRFVPALSQICVKRLFGAKKT